MLGSPEQLQSGKTVTVIQELRRANIVRLRDPWNYHAAYSFRVLGIALSQRPSSGSGNL